MEFKIEVKTYKIVYQCPACGIGTLNYVSNLCTPDVHEYEHKCDKCDCTCDLDKIYPYIKYQENNKEVKQ